MEIGFLADYPEFISVVARWHHDEWSYLRPGDTIEARTTRLRAECGRGQIPSTFVAFSDATPLGSAMLLADDMDTRMHLTPWLASVFVAPEYRRQGIASALIGRVVECAAELGVGQLYLFTPSSQQMYERLGWSVVEYANYHGEDVAVMMRQVRR